MKKLIPLVLLFAACRSASHDGTYVNHSQSVYSISDDTIIVRDTILINHSGFQKIRNGKVLPKEFKTKQLFELHPQFNANQLILNNTTYEKL